MVNMVSNGTQFSVKGKWHLPEEQVARLNRIAETYKHLTSFVAPDSALDSHLMVANGGFRNILIDGEDRSTFALCSYTGSFAMQRYAIQQKAHAIFQERIQNPAEADLEGFQRDMEDFNKGEMVATYQSERFELPGVYGAGYDVVYQAAIEGVSAEDINALA